MALLISVSALNLGCSEQQTSIETLTGDTMGTTYTVKFRRSEGVPPDSEMHEQILARLAEIDRMMSTWRDDSEVSVFNSSRSLEWFPVSAGTVEVVAAAQRVSEQSDGAFDITIRPALQAWGFGSDAGDATPPSPETLEALQARVGFRELEYRREPPALRKLHAELTIDLSALAKGYGVDVLAEYMEAAGVGDFMVEIGGEVRTAGLRDGSQGWKIGIELPTEKLRQLHSTTELSGQSLATSGDYRQFFTSEGVRYSHMMDPRSLTPTQHELASVSVISESCMQADALATALLVMGTDLGLEWSEKNSVAALFIERDGDDYRESSSSAFRNFAPEKTEQESSVAGTNLWLILGSATVVFLIAVAGMASGVMISNRRLQGSCGGLASMTSAGSCSLCGNVDAASAECSDFAHQDSSVCEQMTVAATHQNRVRAADE